MDVEEPKPEPLMNAEWRVGRSEGFSGLDLGVSRSQARVEVRLRAFNTHRAAESVSGKVRWLLSMRGVPASRVARLRRVATSFLASAYAKSGGTLLPIWRRAGFSVPAKRKPSG